MTYTPTTQELSWELSYYLSDMDITQPIDKDFIADYLINSYDLPNDTLTTLTQELLNDDTINTRT